MKHTTDLLCNNDVAELSESNERKAARVPEERMSRNSRLSPTLSDEQAGEVAQAGDQGRFGTDQQSDVLAGAAQQVGTLDPLHVNRNH